MWLDHLVEPQPLLRLLYGKLGPGGALLVVTHNQQSALARIFGARWPAYCLQHPQLYAPSSLEENLRRAGFDPVRVQPTTNHFPVMYLLRHLLFAARLGRVPLPEWARLDGGPPAGQYRGDGEEGGLRKRMVSAFA